MTNFHLSSPWASTIAAWQGPLRSVPGIGPKLAGLLTHLVGGRRVWDLVSHAPEKVRERRFFSSLRGLIQAFPTLSLDTAVTVEGVVNDYSRHPSGPVRITLSDGTGYLDLVFFKGEGWAKRFPRGSRHLVSGTVTLFQSKLQMVHPDFMGGIQDRDFWSKSELVYPLTTGLQNRVLRRIISRTLSFLPPLPSPSFIPPRRAWDGEIYSPQEAFYGFHRSPSSQNEDLRTRASAQYLAFLELLCQQVHLLRVRNSGSFISGPCFPKKKWRKTFLENLPWELTSCQKRVLEETERDLDSGRAMHRLVQGDVGSGKTVVAVGAALSAIESGYQVVFLAPTAILAKQHFETIRSWIEPLGISVELLVGGASQRMSTRRLTERLRNKEPIFLVGTHALLEDEIDLPALGLAVIDEQHRFGVEQRMRLLDLKNQSYAPHLLAMSATPIPRSLQLVRFGDMDVSFIRTKPAGRKPIETRLIPQERRGEVLEGLRRLLSKGEQVFWICPLVEESEGLDLAAAEERATTLKLAFGEEKVGLVHGRMKGEEKNAVMESFREGVLKILVSTTVVEVGVDIPNASLMVIEHAERFGLAQLHQLRGRVGRGDQPAYCILLFSERLSEVGRQRLEVMRETNDGFVIAEADLQIRGGGDLLGTAQSGHVPFKFVDPVFHSGFLEEAHTLATVILKDGRWEDPDFQCLLSLFAHTSGDQLMRAG